MADIKVDAETQINPPPLKIGTGAGNAMPGNTKIPAACLIRVNASSTTVQIYSSRGIPAGTYMGVCCNYIASSTGAGTISFSKNTNLSSWTGVGGADGSRYECFISGYLQTAVAIPAGVWTSIGTVSLGANGTQCYGGIGIEY